MGSLRSGSPYALAFALFVNGGCGDAADDMATSQASGDSSGLGSTGPSATSTPVTATSTTSPTSTSTGSELDTTTDTTTITTTGTEGADSTTGLTTGIEGDVLELDPQTLVYFGLPIDSERYAVGGHDPARNACVAIIFSISGGMDPEMLHCDDFVLGNDPASFPYVVITPDASPPCEQWQYAPNVDAVAASGCVQIHLFPAPLHIDIDMTLEIESEIFTGTITVDNLTP